jgi:hypothetical protein
VVRLGSFRRRLVGQADDDATWNRLTRRDLLSAAKQFIPSALRGRSVRADWPSRSTPVRGAGCGARCQADSKYNWNPAPATTLQEVAGQSPDNPARLKFSRIDWICSPVVSHRGSARLK